MPALQVKGFQGVVQATHPLALPDTVGAAGNNMRPGFSDLRPWFQPSVLALAANTVVSGAMSLYRYGADSSSSTTYWCTWNTDVDVARGLVGNDVSERTYYTDGVLPKWFDNTFALAAPPYPNNPRTLGVPAPTTAPSVVATGGASGSKEARVYVWTWVTDKGEESAPSAPSAVTPLSPVDATWTVTFNQSVPTYTGNIVSRNLYRSATTSNGSAVYLFVANITNLSSGYACADNTPDTMLGSALQSMNWQMPVANMVGLTPMWDGMMAGFFSKTICFCVPFVPYAWPIIYQQVIPETVVGLGVWQQNLIVLTDGQPYAITGTDPTALTITPIDASFSCTSKRSICEVPGGLLWASPDGLAYSGSRGNDSVSDLVFSREQWQALNPASMVVRRWGSFVVVRYNNGTDGALVFDWEKANAVYPNKLKIKEVYPCSTQFDNAYYDKLSGVLYLLNTANQTISVWDGSATYGVVSFTSKIFRETKAKLYLWAFVRADVYPVQLTLTVDGVVRLNNFTVTSGTPFKLPLSGFKGKEWQVSINGNGPLQEVVLANSVDELQGVA